MRSKTSTMYEFSSPTWRNVFKLRGRGLEGDALTQLMLKVTASNVCRAGWDPYNSVNPLFRRRLELCLTIALDLMRYIADSTARREVPPLGDASHGWLKIEDDGLEIS
jgi:hypothetical protein